MMLVTMSLLLLLGASAIAVDLAAMRLDRSADQKVTDSAASAGALIAFDGGSGEEACVAALGYVEANTPGISTGDLVDPTNPTECAPLAGSCDATTAARSTGPITAGRFAAVVIHPVPDGHELMTSAQLGAPSQTEILADGVKCDRVGVQMSATHESLFAQLLGFDQGTTTVHSVALGFLPPPDGPPLNLVVLDRYECQGIRVEGNGGVVVNPVFDGSNAFEGLAAADSDGSSGIDCVDEEGETAGVIHIKGSGPPPLLRADGPPGCSTDDLSTPTIGEGCGLIQVFADGTPGCNFPACTPGGGGANPPIPLPTELPERLTRLQIDHTYNCWDDYDWDSNMPSGVDWATEPLNDANEQSIPDCTGSTAHIYDLLAAVTNAGSGGHRAWTGAAPAFDYPCNVTAGDSFTADEDAWINCDDFVVEGTAIIQGNVIFQGNVHVKSHGRLEIDNTDGWAVFRGNAPTGTGEFKKDGQADVIFEQTMVYLSKTSWVDIAGGDNGVLRWNAPTSNSSAFKDLALWSDSPSTHFWSGQGTLEMSGAFFTPLATADYSGTSDQNQTEAQWIADKLIARGQGQLAIQPKFSHPFKRDPIPQTELIR